MATPAEVDAAVLSLVARLAEVDPEVRGRYALDRTVSCHITDLDVRWSARWCDDGLRDVTDSADERAQVRLALTSDDLVALTEGRLPLPTAWASGRLRIQANPLDLLRLRALL